MSENLPSVLGTDAELPAYLRQSDDSAADANALVTGTLSLPKLSIRGKQFRYM